MKRDTPHVLVIVLLIERVAAAQAASVHEQIQQTYNFQPHLLNDQEITQADCPSNPVGK